MDGIRWDISVMEHFTADQDMGCNHPSPHLLFVVLDRSVLLNKYIIIFIGLLKAFTIRLTMSDLGALTIC